MPKYVYQWSELWRDGTSIVDRELSELCAWLHRSGIDPDFDPEEHVYVNPQGDRQLFLPELTQSQLFAATLILSSSELTFDNRPVRFDRPPTLEQETDNS